MGMSLVSQLLVVPGEALLGSVIASIGGSTMRADDESEASRTIFRVTGQAITVGLNGGQLQIVQENSLGVPKLLNSSPLVLPIGTALFEFDTDVAPDEGLSVYRVEGSLGLAVSVILRNVLLSQYLVT
jgi:hypothetical protein